MSQIDEKKCLICEALAAEDEINPTNTTTTNSTSIIELIKQWEKSSRQLLQQVLSVSQNKTDALKSSLNFAA